MKMKLLLFLMICLSVACTKQSRVIDYPVIDNKNTTIMEVYRVELTDTATILYAEMYNRPNYLGSPFFGCLSGRCYFGKENTNY